jgi:hypothetical protein
MTRYGGAPVPADKYWALREASERSDKFWTILYRQLALLAGDLPDFKRLAIAHRDVKAALK